MVLFSGILTTLQIFDREKQREHPITVTATDQAAEPLIGICQINVVVSDVNDNSPRFENTHYECNCESLDSVSVPPIASLPEV